MSSRTLLKYLLSLFHTHISAEAKSPNAPFFLCGAVCGRATVDLKCLPLRKLITVLAHSICYSRRHQVVFYLMTGRVYRTVHLVLRLYLSSGCCRRSFTTGPEDSLSVLLDKYLFSIKMKFPSVCFSVTVAHCRKQLKLEVTAFV